ncbi:MAG TPA: glycoside hydrolase family 15 protein [Candidatus Binataceae bacterium]|nr:glycoside hydrolase family 15 protein [Candidatus Binataceae bacterium]
MSLRIEDYAIIGDTCTAALVGRDGSIDWLCAPRFDSGACFAALLGSANNGFWRLAPVGGEPTSQRCYRADTLILEASFVTASGNATVIDFMPASGRPGRVALVRIVKGTAGTVRMCSEAVFRFDYGRTVPWIRQREGGFNAVAGPNAVTLRSTVPVRSENGEFRAEFTIEEGATEVFVAEFYPSHEREPEPCDGLAMLSVTEQWWRAWAGQCRWEGPLRDAVVRSAITLKALTYWPTAGIIAAPTTSLPESLGGQRNWDYRYCWLRDSTFTLYALLLCGYADEAKEWREWLLRAIAGRPQDMQIMYGLAGERDLPEFEVPWLGGYADSKPVRIGNAAHQQFQLDVYGEVMDTLYVAGKYNVPPDQDVWRMQGQLMDFIESAWQHPDEGIWEIRGERQHFTHSKVMAWVAADRAVKSINRYKVEGPIAKWTALRDQIHREVCARGFDPKRNSFVQHYDSEALDASLLMIPLVGFLPAHDPRVRGTVEAIQKELMIDGLVRRYATESGVDGLPPGEGAFLPCSFWLADNLAVMGRYDEARELFEKLLALRNDVGLLAEEYDPAERRQTGNFPQALTHVCLINTAHNLMLGSGPAVERGAHNAPPPSRQNKP